MFKYNVFCLYKDDFNFNDLVDFELNVRLKSSCFF